MSPKIGVPYLQYIPRNMHTVFALLWLSSGLLHWHCGNLTIAPVPAKQPWWIWINTSCEFIMNDCITTTKQSTTKPCAYFLRYTVWIWPLCLVSIKSVCRLPWMITDIFMHSIHYITSANCWKSYCNNNKSTGFEMVDTKTNLLHM